MKLSPEAENVRQLRIAHLRNLVKLRRRMEKGLHETNNTLAVALHHAHGSPADGGLTYRELAEIVGLSRQRIIQLVNGE